jgi:hypothetical protein
MRYCDLVAEILESGCAITILEMVGLCTGNQRAHSYCGCTTREGRGVLETEGASSSKGKGSKTYKGQLRHFWMNRAPGML